MSLGKIIAAAFLTGLVIVVTYSAAQFYFKSQREADGIEAPVQIYAGEPLPQPTTIDNVKPSLYSCADEKMRVYLVIAASGEFMMFDGNGVWVNNGTFFEATTDKGIHYWHAEIGSSLMGMTKTDSNWRLAIITPQSTMELICV